MCRSMHESSCSHKTNTSHMRVYVCMYESIHACVYVCMYMLRQTDIGHMSGYVELNLQGMYISECIHVCMSVCHHIVCMYLCMLYVCAQTDGLRSNV